jgi:N-acetylmuramoyl-L-alanine amidase
VSPGWIDRPSPNDDERPAGTPVDMLILHGTGLADDVSTHYAVDPDGAIFRLIPEHRRAGFAGISHWRGHEGLDNRSIGVGIVQPNSRLAGHDYPVLQMAALCDLCLDILSRQQIPARNIVGRGEVAPERHADPGEKLDWEGLSRNGVGLWPQDMPGLGFGGATDGAVLDAARLRPVRAALAAIGYKIGPEGPLDPGLSTVLRAFQRHWRPEAVTGQADAGTLARLLGVARLTGESGFPHIGYPLT